MQGFFSPLIEDIVFIFFVRADKIFMFRKFSLCGNVHAFLPQVPNLFSMLHCASIRMLIYSSTFFVLGHLKFWKKKAIGIEFAKHFRSHLGPIEGLAVSGYEAVYCCSQRTSHSYDISYVIVSITKSLISFIVLLLLSWHCQCFLRV